MLLCFIYTYVISIFIGRSVLQHNREHFSSFNKGRLQFAGSVTQKLSFLYSLVLKSVQEIGFAFVCLLFIFRNGCCIFLSDYLQKFLLLKYYFHLSEENRLWARKRFLVKLTFFFITILKFCKCMEMEIFFSPQPVKGEKRPRENRPAPDFIPTGEFSNPLWLSFPVILPNALIHHLLSFRAFIQKTSWLIDCGLAGTPPTWFWM